MAQTCPVCGLLSPDDADTCDCGWSFRHGTMLVKYDTIPASPLWSLFAYIGTILTGVVVLAAFYSTGPRPWGALAILVSLTAWAWRRSRGRVVRREGTTR